MRHRQISSRPRRTDLQIFDLFAVQERLPVRSDNRPAQYNKDRLARCRIPFGSRPKARIKIGVASCDHAELRDIPVQSLWRGKPV